jgi:hypothetical protein
LGLWLWLWSWLWRILSQQIYLQLQRKSCLWKPLVCGIQFAGKIIFRPVAGLWIEPVVDTFVRYVRKFVAEQFCREFEGRLFQIVVAFHAEQQYGYDPFIDR